MPATRPICLWSGPRNVSTALMYSFAQLDSIEVVDEPLYGHYLRVTGLDHPGRDDVLNSMSTDGDAVMRALLKRQARLEGTRLFLKQMAHHLVELDTGFLNHVDNVLLIRDPEDMLPSLSVQIPRATLADTGLEQQWRLFEDLRTRGQRPAVVDSGLLLANPGRVLELLCAHLGIAFDPCMLTWQPGPRPEDGIWAPHWYHAVHRSRGFHAPRDKGAFPESLNELLGQCRPWYDRLLGVAIRPDTTSEH